MTIPESTQSEFENQTRKSGSWGEIIRFALITLLIVVPIRAYVAQPFIVSGTSMVPTFDNGEYLIIDELSYHWRAPRRGEVVVFRFPQNPSKFFIKRIIGLPGETVIIDNRSVAIVASDDIQILSEPYAKNTLPYQTVRLDLEENEYFVMGDNRDVSSDSRIWGPVADSLIKGRVLVRLLPITELSLLPGDAGSLLNNL